MVNFNGIESFDHFSNDTVFWIALSDPPAELERKAASIDGDNFSEACFGVCAIFSAETQKFDLVVDMDRDEARSVCYIDNDGDKHWFACEVPEELTERIFSECQQVLDFQKVEDGYEIKESVQFEDNSGFILAEKPNSERPFLTAYFFTTDFGQHNYSDRKSFHHRTDAAEDFSKRTEYRKQFLRVKPSQTQTDERHRKGAKQMTKSENRPKRKRR